MAYFLYFNNKNSAAAKRHVRRDAPAAREKKRL
jgi:hypothetical protein